jgi:hypothetical protein
MGMCELTMAKEGIRDVDHQSYIEYKPSNAARPAREPIDSKAGP